MSRPTFDRPLRTSLRNPTALTLALLLLAGLAAPSRAILPPFDFVPGLAQPMVLGPGETAAQTLAIFRNTATCAVCQPGSVGGTCCTSTIFTSLSDVPPGVFGCISSPAGCLTTPVPSNGPTVVLTAQSGLVAGDYTLHVTAQAFDGPNPRIQVESIPVHVAPFSLQIPHDVKVEQGEQIVLPLTLLRLPGFTTPVEAVLVGEGSPSFNAELGFGPNGDVSELALDVDPTAPAGTRAVTVQLTSGSETRTVDIPFQIISPFTLAVSPASTKIVPGGTRSFAATLQRGPGFLNPVGFALSAPAGLSGTFSPIFTTGNTSTLTLTAGASLAPGLHTATVRATGSGVVRTKTLQVVVKNLLVTADPVAAVLFPNTTQALALSFERGSAVTGPLALSVVTTPSGGGVAATVSPATLTGNSATLSVHAGRFATPGNYTVTLTVTGAGVSETLTVPALMEGSVLP